MPRLHFYRHKINGEDAVTFGDLQSRASMTIVEVESFNTNVDNNTTVAQLLIPTAVANAETTRTAVVDPVDVGADDIYGSVKVAVVALDSSQLAELGRFCTETSCDLRARLTDIENSIAYVRAALEDWNSRARADEEHPPYDQLVNRLDEGKRALQDLELLRRKP